MWQCVGLCAGADRAALVLGHAAGGFCAAQVWIPGVLLRAAFGAGDGRFAVSANESGPGFGAMPIAAKRGRISRLRAAGSARICARRWGASHCWPR